MAHAEEIIPQPPSKWYLTGFLVPYDAPIEVRSDDTGNDELDAVSRSGAGDDETAPDKAPARKGFFPSSMGVSLLVAAHTSSLQVTASWGDYTRFATDLVPRPDLRGNNGEDWDERVADLQYRDDYEFAVGHNVSAIALVEPNGICQKVWTAWIPTADVEKVIASPLPEVELSMETLAVAPTPAALRDLLYPMIDAYAEWITEQRGKAPSSPKHRAETASDLLNRAVIANQRLAAGLQAMDDPQVFEAFCIANRAVATAIRQRLTHDKEGVTPESLSASQWRPFQLAFLLMNIVGINVRHSDRYTQGTPVVLAQVYTQKPIEEPTAPDCPQNQAPF